MSLKLGTRLGNYEVLAQLGAGGMGEVYKARDLKLGREVALKILPEEFAKDEGRLARFEREARLLASVNHPGVATLYEHVEIDGLRFLSMELVHGETLSERLERGALSVEEALPLLVQIAEALQAAHDKGVIHRDLKPANIMITANGRVKLLDFGLAKDIATTPKSEAAEAPTFSRETAVGVALGTAPYMSPEQTRGQPVDERTDIWAFGCVMYEVLTGKRAFQGATLPDTVANILEREPDWTAIDSATPPALSKLIETSVSKNAADRPRRCEDIIEVLRQSHARRTDGVSSSTRLMIGIGLFAVVILAWITLRSSPEDFTFSNARQLTSGIGVQDLPDWSPDGRMLAYHSNRAGNTDIWIMQADGSNSLNRTADHGGDDMFPVWSPDGTQIAFFSARDSGGIFIIEPLAGAPRRISRKGDVARGRPQWSRDQRSLAYEVRDGVESYVEIMELGSGDSTRLGLPGQGLERPDLSWSPNGQFFAYVDVDQRSNSANRLMLLRVEDGTASALTDEKTLEHAPHWAEDSRTLFFSSNRSGTADMWAQELRRDGQVASEPQALTAGLMIRSAALSPDSSRLAYSSGRSIANIWRVPVLADRPATWADAEQLTFDHTQNNVPDVSIQRRELVVASQRGGNIDLWLLSLDGGEMRQITDDPESEGYPKWSPDGTAVTFHSLRAGTRDIYVRTVDGGPARRLTDDMGEEYLPSWSPDGTQIVFASTRSGTLDIWSVPSGGGEPSQLTTAGFHHPSWSPDGQLLAFHSHPTDEPRIWILPRGETQPTMLTSGSGEGPIWSLDGQEIFFTGANERAGNFWAVDVATRTERRLTDFQGRRGQLRRQGLATDGRYIYFPWRENQSDIWVMDVERN